MKGVKFIQVTYIFDDRKKYDALLDEIMRNENARLRFDDLFGDFNGIQVEVDCREKES